MTGNRPNLFIVGAAKCGTTSLHAQLGAHPEIYMSAVKEPYFFGRDLAIAPYWCVREAGAYGALFAEADGARFVGESSVWYLPSETAAGEIKAYSPEAKIIIMLRHPVEMMFSLHRQFVKTYNEDIEDFEEALTAQEARRVGRRIPRSAHFPQGLQYFEMATFSRQVERYFDVFGRERVEVVLLEDLARDAAGVYGGVLRFLGVERGFVTDFGARNVSEAFCVRPARRFLKGHPGLRRGLQRCLPARFRAAVGRGVDVLGARIVRKRMLDGALRARLTDRFAGEILRLGRLIGRDLAHWYIGAGS